MTAPRLIVPSLTKPSTVSRSSVHTLCSIAAVPASVHSPVPGRYQNERPALELPASRSSELRLPDDTARSGAPLPGTLKRKLAPDVGLTETSMLQCNLTLGQALSCCSASEDVR